MLKSNFPTHIVVDPVSGREVYVDKEKFEVSNSLEIYFRSNQGCYQNLHAIRNRASINELLKFANEVRVAGKGEVIDELLMSTPQEAQACIIANALNFDSTVSDDYGTWGMMIHDKSVIHNICDDLGLDIIEDDYDGVVGVELPENIALVAQAFDTWADVELEQFDVLRQDNESVPV